MYEHPPAGEILRGFKITVNDSDQVGLLPNFTHVSLTSFAFSGFISPKHPLYKHFSAVTCQ